MKAFTTGSRVYGEPTADSDIDLVVLTSPGVITALAELADKEVPAFGLAAPGGASDPGPADSPAGVTASLKFGRLNLICVADLIAYAVWRKGTIELAKRADDTGKPVPRNEAVVHFRALQVLHGLRKPPKE